MWKRRFNRRFLVFFILHRTFCDAFCMRMKEEIFMQRKDEKKILGKLPPDLLLQGVLRYFGAERTDVAVGVGLGEDAAVIQWPDAPYLVAASDPVVGATAGAGRLLVHINANDVACKGADPAWLVVTLIIPSDDGVSMIERIMSEVHETCSELGIAVVNGHTELTDRYNRPVVVKTMLGPSRRLLRKITD